MSSTLFLSNVVNNFDENSDPFHARYLATFNDEQRYNATANRVVTYSLDAGNTKSFSAFLTSTVWRAIIIKVVGEITLTTAGTDPAPVAISGLIGCYGTALFPGWLLLTTQNITASSIITAITDGTVVELNLVTLAADA